MRTNLFPVAYIVSLVQHHGMRYGKAPLSFKKPNRACASFFSLFAALVLVSGLATHALAQDATEESLDGEGGGRRVKKEVSGAIPPPVVPSGANSAGGRSLRGSSCSIRRPDDE